MTEGHAERPADALREAVNRDVAQLIHHLRCSHAPDETLSAAIDHVQQAVQLLRPWLQQGTGWSTVTIADKGAGVPFDYQDITQVMPYSPVSGRRNAIAPPIRLWREDDEVRGEVTFSATYAGPPDSVHGGIIAAVFDELLAMANVISGNAGFTGTLTIRYHRRAPLDTPIALRGVNIRQDGRKQISRGEMLVNGEVIASAEGLFISASKSLAEAAGQRGSGAAQREGGE